jgi:uncharacterized protein (TIGR00255 family)
MTGFGRISELFAEKKITVEIKSLNSKTTDIYFRLPSLYREKELELRTLLIEQLERGKIEMSIHIDQTSPVCTINQNLFKQYYIELQKLSQELKVEENNLFLIASRMPNVLNTDREELDPEEWKFILDLTSQTLQKMINFRQEEGIALEKVLRKYVKNIEDRTKQIAAHEAERLESVKDKIRKNLYELGQKENIDAFRFEQELIYHIERLDITEEKVRLLTHCDYFLETLKKEKNPGKKLNFIVQEMGREINTMGSKANHFEMQKLVIEMKEQLDKIKEQILNVL